MKLLNKLLLTLGVVSAVSLMPSCASVDTSEVSIILPNGTPAIAVGTLLNEVNSEVVTDSTLLQTALTTIKQERDRARTELETMHLASANSCGDPKFMEPGENSLNWTLRLLTND